MLAFFLFLLLVFLVDVIPRAASAPNFTAVLKALFVSTELASRFVTVTQIAPTVNGVVLGFV